MFGSERKIYMLTKDVFGGEHRYTGVMLVLAFVVS